MSGERKINPSIIVQLPGEFTPDTDPEPNETMTCSYQHDPKLALRKRINYPITFQSVSYLFPGVWVNRCDDCGVVYFSQDLGEVIQQELTEVIKSSKYPPLFYSKYLSLF